MESVNSHRPLSPTRPPVLYTLIAGLYLSYVAAALLPYAVRPVAFWLIAIGLGLWSAWHVAGPARLFVGLGVGLTVLSLTHFVPWWLQESLLWSMIAAPVIGPGLSLIYVQLGRRAFPISADSPAHIPPLWIKSALVGLTLVHALGLTMRWAYVDQRCAWFDLTRSLSGCRRLAAFPERTHTAHISADGTRAAAIASIGQLPEWGSDFEAFQRALSAQPAVISVWDVGSGDLLRRLDQPSRVRDIELSGDGRLVAAVSGNQQVQVWSVDDGTLKFTLSHGDDVIRSLVFSPDASILATAALTPDRTNTAPIRLWSLRDGALLRTIPVQEDVDAIIFSPDGQLLAASQRNRVTLWRVGDGTLLHTVGSGELQYSVEWSLAFSPDGQILAVGGTPFARNEQSTNAALDIPIAYLWRVSDATLLHRLQIREVVAADSSDSWQSRVAFSSDGSRLAVGTSTLTDDLDLREVALLWRVADGTLLQRINDLITIDNLHVTADGTRLLLADSSGIYTQAIPAVARQRPVE